MTRPGDEGRQLSHAAAQAAAGDDDVIVYWMPGCIYCDLLKRGLGSARDDVTWVNIVDDAEAAEFVTTYRDGNETVPTAVTGSGEMIDPTPTAIKAQLVAAN
jgi:glutaredoxin